MGKVTGFMEWERELPQKRSVRERLHDWRELYQPQALEQIRQQGGRCMDCGVPFCHQGCPLGNIIPDFNDFIYRDRWQKAYARLASTNNFPEFTGRLCPAPCEGACVLAINSDAVTIEQIEKEIIERAFKEGWVEAVIPRQRTGKKVAVVGSGPAGLAAAAQLNSAGHEVTVYEKADRIGGLLRYGIPDFKLEKWVIDRRLALLEAEGITFHTGVNVGTSPTWVDLRAQYDAIVITVGAERPRELEVPGRDLAGVHRAMDYLARQNRMVAGDALDAPLLDARGKRVIVLGGGDTGSDCLGTALRQAAASVHQIELLPSPPKARTATNPWPQWPMIWRDSTSHEEGGERSFGMLTQRLLGENGKLTALQTVGVDFQQKADGTFGFEERPGTSRSIPVDMLILAMGFVGPDTSTIVQQLGLELDTRGNIKTDGRFATSTPGVFSAGDARRGASLIVWAISEGREAARHADCYLREDAVSSLPARGMDTHFGGR